MSIFFLNFIEQVICNAHTIHLVVTDVFYKKEKPKNDDPEVENEDEEGENEESEESDFNLEGQEDESVELNSQYKDLIGRVRKECKRFKRSPVKNDDGLQVYVIEAEGKEKNLLLDCKTRWNSTVAMCKRFHELRYHVKHALIDMDKSFDFSEPDMKTIEDIVAALEPLQIAVTKLCRRDCTLVKAERILELTMETLSKLETDVGNQIYDAFVERVKARRNADIIHIMEYLSNPDYLKDVKVDSFGAKVDAKKVKEKIIALIKRLYPDSYTETTETTETGKISFKKYYLCSFLIFPLVTRY